MASLCGLAMVALLAADEAPSSPKLTDEMLGRVVRQRALWEHNRLGITDKIPPPWTPMTVSNKRIGCWGRSYDYAESLLPKSVQSQTAEILAGPISLVLKMAGKEVVVQKTDRQSLALRASGRSSTRSGPTAIS